MGRQRVAASWAAAARRLHREFQRQTADECLNQHWFLSLTDARRTIDAWHLSYNTARPHRALGTLTPSQFAHQLQVVKTTRLSA